MKAKAWLSANKGKDGIGVHKSKVYVEGVKDKDKRIYHEEYKEY